MTDSTFRRGTSLSHLEDARVRQAAPHVGDRCYGMCGRLRTDDTSLEH